jgi:hypothetical protein
MTTKIIASVHSWEPQASGNFVRGVVYGLDGTPQNGYGVTFSAVGPNGPEALERPDITGPHPDYEDWPDGYYSTILHVPVAIEAPFWMWLMHPETGERLSDVAIIDNTQDELRGMSQCVCDWWTIEAEPPPPPPPPPPADPLLAIRNAAWNQLGIPYNPAAAFPTYARAHGLGNPVTTEFDIEGYRAQGYQGGILMCAIGQWDKIGVVPW